jgi:imidazolonepropionase-like amidohydrolase
MTRIIAFVGILVIWNPGAAQDLVITNARIIDGTGATIDQGSVVVSDGRIVSVSVGASEAQALLEIDAQGMTVMPGMIDTHVHVLIGSTVPASEAAIDRWIETELPGALKGYLAAGLTTVDLVLRLELVDRLPVVV